MSGPSPPPACPRNGHQHSECLTEQGCCGPKFVCLMYRAAKQTESSESGAEKGLFRAKQGERATRAQKTQTPRLFCGDEFSKAKFGVRAAGCVTFFWLVGGEVIGWCFWNLNLLVPASLGSTCLWSACGHHPPPGWWWGFRFCRTTQRYVPGCCPRPSGGSWRHVTRLSYEGLESARWNSGKAWRLKPFAETKEQEIWRGSCTWEGSAGSCCFLLGAEWGADPSASGRSRWWSDSPER